MKISLSCGGQKEIKCCQKGWIHHFRCKTLSFLAGFNVSLMLTWAAFQFWKAEISDLFNKQFRNEDFLNGIEEGTVQVLTAPLCEVWQITLLKSSTEMQGNHPREASSLPRKSTE